MTYPELLTDEGNLAPRERAVRKFWFDRLDEHEQDTIIKPHFLGAHPTNDDVRKVVKEYEDECSPTT